MKPVDDIVLIGHNSFVFDTPRLLRNGGREFSNQLQEMKVLLTDSLPIIKFIRSQPNNVLKSSPNNKLGSVYKALFNCEFPTHDALVHVKALARIISSVLNYFHEPWTWCFTWLHFRTFLVCKFHYLLRTFRRSRRTTNKFYKHGIRVCARECSQR